MLLLLAPERALFCCLFQILFYAGRIRTSLTVSTMPGIHEYLPSYAYFSKFVQDEFGLEVHDVVKAIIVKRLHCYRFFRENSHFLF